MFAHPSCSVNIGPGSAQPLMRGTVVASFYVAAAASAAAAACLNRRIYGRGFITTLAPRPPFARPHYSPRHYCQLGCLLAGFRCLPMAHIRAACTAPPRTHRLRRLGDPARANRATAAPPSIAAISARTPNTRRAGYCDGTFQFSVCAFALSLCNI